jgi:hypothetical protein
MKRATIFIGLTLVVLSGCTNCKLNYPIIEPVYPKAKTPFNDPIDVKSLQPTLTWLASNGSDVSYDLAIFEAYNLGARYIGTKGYFEYQRGKQIYYREGLMTTEHTIEEPLQPATIYCWSVRIRRDSEVTEWSTYDASCDEIPVVTHIGDVTKLEFIFKTPAK